MLGAYMIALCAVGTSKPIQPAPRLTGPGGDHPPGDRLTVSQLPEPQNSRALPAGHVDLEPRSTGLLGSASELALELYLGNPMPGPQVLRSLTDEADRADSDISLRQFPAKSLNHRSR